MKVQIVYGLVVALMALMVLTEPALAAGKMGTCGMRGDPWFTASYAADHVMFAPGVEAGPSADNQFMQISNTSDSPVYVVLTTTDNRLAPPELPTARNSVIVRLAERQVWSWEAQHQADAPSWVPLKHAQLYIPPNQPSDVFWISMSDDRVFPGINPAFASDIPYGDGRPKKVTMPPAKQFALTIVQDGVAITKPLVTKTYVLNQDYDPHAKRKTDRSCNMMGLGFMAMVFGPLILVCVGGVIAFLAIGAIGVAVFSRKD